MIGFPSCPPPAPDAPAPAQPGGRVKAGVLSLTAGYTDAGAEGALPLRGEASIVLHSRRKKAALYDVNHGMQYVEGVAAENGLLGLFEHGDYIVFRDLNLDGIKSILVHAGNLTKDAARFELRQSSPKGKVLALIFVGSIGRLCLNCAVALRFVASVSQFVLGPILVPSFSSTSFR